MSKLPNMKDIGMNVDGGKDDGSSCRPQRAYYSSVNSRILDFLLLYTTRSSANSAGELVLT